MNNNKYDINDSVEEKVNKYISFCDVLEEYKDKYDNRDVNRANAVARQLEKYSRALNEDPDAKEVYGRLLDSDKVVVLRWAGANCLRCGFWIERAEEILTRISNVGIGVDALNATLTLAVWRGEFKGKTL